MNKEEKKKIDTYGVYRVIVVPTRCVFTIPAENKEQARQNAEKFFNAGIEFRMEKITTKQNESHKKTSNN